VILNGPEGIFHKNRRKKSNHTPDQYKINKIIKLKNTNKYEKTNFAHFQELQKNTKIYKYSIPDYILIYVKWIKKSK